MWGKWCRVKASGSHEWEQPEACLVPLSLPFFYRKKTNNIMWSLFWIDLHPRINCWLKEHVVPGGVFSSPFSLLSPLLLPRGSRIREGPSESKKPLLWRVRFQSGACLPCRWGGWSMAACWPLAGSDHKVGGAKERPPPLPFHPPLSALLSVEDTSEVTNSKCGAEEWVVSSELFFG